MTKNFEGETFTILKSFLASSLRACPLQTSTLISLFYFSEEYRGSNTNNIYYPRPCRIHTFLVMSTCWRFSATDISMLSEKRYFWLKIWIWRIFSIIFCAATYQVGGAEMDLRMNVWFSTSMMTIFLSFESLNNFRIVIMIKALKGNMKLFTSIPAIKSIANCSQARPTVHNPTNQTHYSHQTNAQKNNDSLLWGCPLDGITAFGIIGIPLREAVKNVLADFFR